MVILYIWIQNDLFSRISTLQLAPDKPLSGLNQAKTNLGYNDIMAEVTEEINSLGFSHSIIKLYPKDM